MQNQTISVIGLGKLGLCLAASFAKRGIDVVGVDVLPEVIDELNQGRTLLREPGLSELLAEIGGKRLKATLSHPAAIEQRTSPASWSTPRAMMMGTSRTNTY